MPPSALMPRRCAKKNMASGKPGAGLTRPAPCATWPAAWPRWACSVAEPGPDQRQPATPVFWLLVAAQALGAVPVPLYQDAVATEMTFVMQDAEITVAFAENQEQVDKLLEVREIVPSIRTIIYDDPRGLRNYNQPGLISMEQACWRKAQAWDKAHPQAWDAMVAPSRRATSPSSLHLGHHRQSPRACARRTPASSVAARRHRGGQAGPERQHHFLPAAAWVGDHLFLAGPVAGGGFTINCPESAATVSIDMREIGPTYYFAPPRACSRAC